MRTEIHSQEHKRLRSALKRERVTAGLRQSDLAEKSGRSQAYISKYERGELRLDVVDFMLFCTIMGCDPHAIIDEVFEIEPSKGSFAE